MSRAAWLVEPCEALRGESALSGDKSISHRALLVGALCDQPVRISGFGINADTQATLGALRALGVGVDEHDQQLVVNGVGLTGLDAPKDPIDAANAGTLIRLLAGIVCGQRHGTYVLDGDASLRRRPMERIAAPLRLMGADITTTAGAAPVRIQAGSPLTGIDYTLPVASAQVKSCLLLAGLNAAGATSISEPAATRDHTERLLRAAGVRVQRDANTIRVTPPRRLRLESIDVPGDFSSAAFLISAATLIPGSELHLVSVGVNPGRTGLLTVLERMGGRVGVHNRRTTTGGEPVADIEVRPAELTATRIEPALIAQLVDELPVIALLCACARGTSVISGAGELRHKESDRIATVSAALASCGARIESTPDGWRIRGVPARLRGGYVDAEGDHRVAMMAAIAGLYSEQGVRIIDPSSIDVSFPGFRDLIKLLARVPEREAW